MNWTRTIVYVVLAVAGAGLLMLLPGIKGRIAEVEALLADADEVLSAHQARPTSIPGFPDEVETELQRYRMSYLAVIKEKRFQRTSVLVCGPLLIAFGVIALLGEGWKAVSKGKKSRRSAPTQKKPAPRKRPQGRRKPRPKPRPKAGRPRNRRRT